MSMSLVWVSDPSLSPGPQNLSKDSAVQKYRMKPHPKAREAAWKVARRGVGDAEGTSKGFASTLSPAPHAKEK